VVTKLELDPTNTSTFKYHKLLKHVLDIAGSVNVLPLKNSEGPCMAVGVSHYAIPAGVQLLQMPVVVLPAIPSKETPAPLHTTEEIPITKAEYTITTDRDPIPSISHGKE